MKKSFLKRNYNSKLHLRVVRDNPITRFLTFLLISLGFFFSIIATYYFGGYSAQQELNLLRTKYKDANDSMVNCQSSKEVLKQQLVIQEHTGNFDRSAAERVRVDLKQLKDENAKLKKELSLYNNVLALKDESLITIQRFELQPTTDVRRFQWKLVLSQTAIRHPFQKGILQLSLVGHRNGKEIAIPLNQVSPEVNSEYIPIGFKYFQSIPSSGGFADIILPENFRPSYLHLVVNIENPKKWTLDKRLNWIVEEANSHVEAIQEKNENFI